MPSEDMEYRDGTRRQSSGMPAREIEPRSEGNTFSVRLINMDAGENTVVLHLDDARLWGLHSQDRIKVARGGKSVTALVHTTVELLEPGELGALRRVRKQLELKDGDEVKVFLTGRPESALGVLQRLGDDSRLYLLPMVLDGEPCYRICWGTYRSREAALSNTDTPAQLLGLNPEPLPRRISDLLR